MNDAAWQFRQWLTKILAPRCSAATSVTRWAGNVSQGMPPSAACALDTNASAASRDRISLFIRRAPALSMAGVDDAVGHRLELAQAAPPRHQQEEGEVVNRAHLRDQREDVRRRLGAQVAQDQEEHHEHAV